MQIIDFQEKKNHVKKKKKTNHAVNKTTINNSCYGYLKKNEI